MLFEAFHMCALIAHYGDNPLLVLLFQKPSKFGNSMQKEGRKFVAIPQLVSLQTFPPDN